MENGVHQGFVREWSPCTLMLSLIPARVQTGLFSTEVRLTCIDAISEYIALGTNLGLVYWYNRKSGTIERLRCEANQSSITYVKIVNTVDYMVAAGNTLGQVTVFQIPKPIPDSIPDKLKPKNEPKVERYTVGDLHKSKITSIEWAKNGMRLFSGDKNGILIMTEIDFYMHICKSVEIVNEKFEIVQISYYKDTLLVSSLFRTILCESKEGRWQINQVGKRERKSLCPLGGVLQSNPAAGGDVAGYCARPGLRLWSVDKGGEVLHTLLFKDNVNNPSTVVELLNPYHTKHQVANAEYQFGPLHIFRDEFIVTYNQDLLYILDPRTSNAVSVVDDLRRIMSVSVNKDEIFILEGERSVVRLGHSPEANVAKSGEDPLNVMTKSLTTTIQLAVNTVRDLANSEPVKPFITSIIDRTSPTCEVQKAEECFELPPVKELPSDIAANVLESMIESYKEDKIEFNMDELQKRMKLYNMIAEPKRDEKLIFSSKRNKKTLSANNTPVRQPNFTNGVKKVAVASYTPESVCSTNTDESDDEINKQIEEKEKILAKMLDLESLGDPVVNQHDAEKPPERQIDYFSSVLPVKNDIMTRSYPISNVKKYENIVPSLDDFDISLPQMTEVPKNWNLRSLKVVLDPVDSKLDEKSPDIGSDWEFV